MTRVLQQTCGAILLLAVWIATPLLSVAHVALEEHRYCAEHERLEEGVEHASPSAVTNGTVDTSGSVYSAHSDEPQSKHEGCAFGEDFTRESLCYAKVSLVALSVGGVDSAPSLDTGDAAESIPLLRLAPKSSPPQIL